MKKFFLGVLSSFLGAWIAILLLGVAALMVVGGILVKLGASESSSGVKKNSVAVLSLKGTIVETAKNIDFNLQDIVYGGGMEKTQRLDLLVEGIKEAADDDKIDALYIKCEAANASPATLDVLRKSLKEFKKSKKPIYAYADYMTEGDYYVASVADSIFINPQGALQLSGVSRSSLYLGSLFRKIGVEFQIAKVGAYKSAVEPFVMDEMSEPARLQLDTLCNSIWSQYVGEIAESRKINPEYIDSLADRCVMFSKIGSLRKSGLFDAVSYEREMDTRFCNITGKKKKDDLNFVNVTDLPEDEISISEMKGDHIAVLYATGEISDGNKDQIDCYTLVPVILDLAEDEHVKGLVLRVNSPGGSVFGSEQIADALAQFKKTGKPFSVSMGDYAASGGYWISCDADRIFANSMTVTGSIGIFGVIPNLSGLMENVGVSLQGYSTNPNGDVAIPLRPLNDVQMAAFTESVRAGYDEFVARVAKGRKIPEKRVREIAEGRVYDGKLALSLRLVDELGNLDSAIEWTAKKAGLKKDEYSIYPKVEFSFMDMLAQSESNPLSGCLRNALGTSADPRMILAVRRILTASRCQARLPYLNIKL